MSEYMKICHVLMSHDTVGHDVNLLKLMKLVYISHGFLLATVGRDPYIGKDKFEAWDVGPALPELHWAYHRDYDECLGGEAFRRDVLRDNNRIDNEEHRETVNFVACKYGQFSVYELTEFTHKDGAPWKLCYGKRTRNMVIPDKMIKEYYDLLVKNLNRMMGERQQALKVVALS